MQPQSKVTSISKWLSAAVAVIMTSTILTSCGDRNSVAEQGQAKNEPDQNTINELLSQVPERLRPEIELRYRRFESGLENAFKNANQLTGIERDRALAAQAENLIEDVERIAAQQSRQEQELKEGCRYGRDGQAG